MTDFAALLQPDRGQSAHVVHLVDKGNVEDWLKRRSADDRALLAAHRFDGKSAHAFAVLPRGKDVFEAVAAVAKADRLSPWCLAKLASALPEGVYRLGEGDPGQAALGWLLAQHRLDSYRSTKDKPEAGARVLLTRDVAHIDSTVRLADATALVRDLVDTPAGDLGPAELESAVRELGGGVGGDVRVTSGADLDQGYPLIAAVGRAAARGREPRLVELEWGDPSHPRIAIVGKGVCFDSGGLDIKPAAGMRLMKKDMGGAAHAIALARLAATERLPVRLHLLIPAVENSVSGSAVRPGDIIRSRAGVFVEIDNTDAEGRLILADALTRAGEDDPELIVDFATLTGAARVALGPDLPAMFSNDDDLAAGLESAAKDVADPLWRMPLWYAYDEMLKSDIADIANASATPFAGAVVAAMFLKRFVKPGTRWAHFDTFAWRPNAKPGRPKGGDALGLRATFAMLKDRYPPR
jgi:leucyl aminopeptidase